MSDETPKLDDEYFAKQSIPLVSYMVGWSDDPSKTALECVISLMKQVAQDAARRCIEIAQSNHGHSPGETCVGCIGEVTRIRREFKLGDNR